MGLCVRKSNFKPALSFAHGLVIYLFKADLVYIKVEGFVLIADPYRDGTDFRKHVSSILSIDWKLPLRSIPTRGSIPTRQIEYTPIRHKKTSRILLFSDVQNRSSFCHPSIRHTLRLLPSLLC